MEKVTVEVLMRDTKSVIWRWILFIAAALMALGSVLWKGLKWIAIRTLGFALDMWALLVWIGGDFL